MPLPMRVSLNSCRLGNPLKPQLSLSNVTKNINSSFRRKITTEANKTASSSSSQSRLLGVGNVLLGTLLVGAGAGTVYFTYLRMQNMGVAANTIMDDGLHPAAHPWPNNHLFATFDHARYIFAHPVLRFIQSIDSNPF